MYEVCFIGRRVRGDLHVDVERMGLQTRLPWRLEEYNGSPTGFECGYSGAGPTQLAYSMIRELGFSKEAASRVVYYVRDRVVAKLRRETQGPGELWVLDSGVVIDAVMEGLRTAKDSSRFVRTR
jgi:hypothetical protein